MRIAVTGRHGQIVRSISERAKRNGENIIPIGRPELDLSGDARQIIGTIIAASPDAIVSAAAYTAVDKAESERTSAFAINERGAAAVAEAAEKLRVPIIHVSTDYVFDGSKPTPYSESDRTGPTSVYGASKLAGEAAVVGAHLNSSIARTAWVYSPFGANFVRTMLRLAGERDEVSVVSDQLGNPTSALDIADAILAMAAQLVSSPDRTFRGLFHMTALGEASWAEFAREIFAISAAVGGPTAAVRPVQSSEYQTAARRPKNSRLDSSKLQQAYGIRLPSWRTSLPAVVQRLVLELTERKAS